MKKVDYEKCGGLVPAIIQDFSSGRVLMLGYMNAEALNQTISKGLVTFYSRTKNRLWTKGEESGHFLDVKDISVDCDGDTLLIKATPRGPTCHLGTSTCFGETVEDFTLESLENIVRDRKYSSVDGSYTKSLLKAGLAKIAQKVGEEATEVIVAALSESNESLKEECADLIFHLIVLLQSKEIHLSEILEILKERRR